MRPLKYLGAASKHEVLMLLDSVVKDEGIDFVGVGHLPIVKKCLKSLDRRLQHFYELFVASLANCFNQFDPEKLSENIEFLRRINCIQQLWEARRGDFSEEVQKPFSSLLEKMGNP